MVRTTALAISRGILQLLQSRGYVLVRQPAHANMTPRADHAIALPSAPAELFQPAPSAPAAPPEFVSGPVQAGEIEDFLKRARSAIGGEAPVHATAVFISARHLLKNRVPGDVVDCGDGSTTNLTLMATALAMLGDVSRRLIMFDVSGDASHRPELELPLWGMDTSDLIDPRTAKFARTPDAARPLPKELVETGYPHERIHILHYPIDVIDLSQPTAYLGLVADSYDSNRAAIRALFPTVCKGGIIAVEGTNELRRKQPGCVQYQIDAVSQYLTGTTAVLEFWRPTPRFRLAINRSPAHVANASAPDANAISAAVS